MNNLQARKCELLNVGPNGSNVKYVIQRIITEEKWTEVHSESEPLNGKGRILWYFCFAICSLESSFCIFWLDWGILKLKFYKCIQSVPIKKRWHLSVRSHWTKVYLWLTKAVTNFDSFHKKQYNEYCYLELVYSRRFFGGG